MNQQRSLSLQILNVFNALKIANAICYISDSRGEQKKKTGEPLGVRG